MRRLPPLRFLVATTLVLLWLCWLASMAQAASLKACFTDPADPDIKAAVLFAGTAVVDPDILTGSSLVNGTRCMVMTGFSPPPFGAGFPRGQSVAVTLKFVNSLGEVGPASNAITFRAANLPAAPTLVSVGATAP